MKKIMILLILLLSFTFLSSPVQAAEIRDSLVPEEDDKKIGSVELQYAKYPVSHYSMDTKIPENEWGDILPTGWDNAASKSLWQMMATVNSIIWQFITLIGSWTGKLVEYAFTLDFIDSMINEIDRAISNIAGVGAGGFTSDGLFPMFALTFFVILGVYMVWIGLIKKAHSQAIGVMIQTIVLLTLCFAYVINAGPFLKYINDSTTDVSQSMLAWTSSITDSDGTYSKEEGYANMRNSIFNTMIYQPWLIAEFGTTDEDKIESEYKRSGSRINDLLKTEDYSKERLKQIDYEVEEQGNSNMEPQALTDRFVLLGFTSIGILMMALILILISGSIIFFSFMAIIFALLGPIALLISLLPTYSGNAITWLSKLLHPFLMKIAFCFLISVLFAIQTMINSSIDPDHGFFTMMLVYLCLTIGLWVYRDQFLSLIVKPTKRSGLSTGSYTRTADYKNTYQKGKGYINRFTKPLSKPATPQHQRASHKIKYNPGVGASERNWRAYTMSNSKYQGSKGVKSAPNPVESNKTTDRTSSDQSTASKTKKQNKTTNNQTARIDNTSYSNKHQPPEISKEDLNSLDRTTNKGGWGYRSTEQKEASTTRKKSAGDFRMVKSQDEKANQNNVVDRTGGMTNDNKQ
ncbi:CD3337/EF1877 family mobilome membrane protein [Halobacillus sp. H74]|uniref:CD3337/EF1877 family mobilome membrane protein n=1 Tax=Halobacillus sp. H74 TaxID=3457436 RepID=UPI003FCDE58B